MKKIIFIGVALLALAGCGNKKTDSTAQSKESSVSSSSVIKSSTTSQTTEKTTESTTQKAVTNQQSIGSINDFVGGWGVPQSDNLFFINADNTLTGSTGAVLPLGNVNFTQDADGSLVMTSDQGVFTKHADGTVTVNNQNYQYLGNLTFDQLVAQNNAQNAQTNNNTTAVDQDNVAVPNDKEYDQVQPGDTVATIAARNGLTVQQFKDLNPENIIVTGDWVKVK